MELRKQRCEACAGNFGCGAETGGCWCNDLALDATALARLREAYERCLCPSCLGTVAGGEAVV